MVERLGVEGLSTSSGSVEERLAAGYVRVTPLSPYGCVGYAGAYPIQPAVAYSACAVTPVAAVALPAAVGPAAPIVLVPYGAPSTVVVKRNLINDDCCTGCLAAMCFCCLLDAMAHP